MHSYVFVIASDNELSRQTIADALARTALEILHTKDVEGKVFIDNEVVGKWRIKNDKVSPGE